MSELGQKLVLTAPKSNFRFALESGPDSDIAKNHQRTLFVALSRCARVHHDLEGEIRGLAYKKKKLLFRDGNKLNVGDRQLAVNQCHIPQKNRQS